MVAAGHGDLAALLKLGGDLVGAGGEAGHEGDRHDVGVGIEIDGLDVLVYERYFVLGRRHGGDRGQTQDAEAQHLAVGDAAFLGYAVALGGGENEKYFHGGSSVIVRMCLQVKWINLCANLVGEAGGFKFCIIGLSRGRGTMAEHYLAKVETAVRFRSPAPLLPSRAVFSRSEKAPAPNFCRTFRRQLPAGCRFSFCPRLPGFARIGHRQGTILGAAIQFPNRLFTKTIDRVGINAHLWT